MTNSEMLQAFRFAERGVVALERIATALERANDSDPLLAIQAALAHESEDATEAQRGALTPPLDPNADMPPHIRRLLGLE